MCLRVTEYVIRRSSLVRSSRSMSTAVISTAIFTWPDWAGPVFRLDLYYGVFVIMSAGESGELITYTMGDSSRATGKYLDCPRYHCTPAVTGDRARVKCEARGARW